MCQDKFLIIYFIYERNIIDYWTKKEDLNKTKSILHLNKYRRLSMYKIERKCEEKYSKISNVSTRIFAAYIDWMTTVYFVRTAFKGHDTHKH